MFDPAPALNGLRGMATNQITGITEMTTVKEPIPLEILRKTPLEERKRRWGICGLEAPRLTITRSDCDCSFMCFIPRHEYLMREATQKQNDEMALAEVKAALPKPLPIREIVRRNQLGEIVAGLGKKVPLHLRKAVKDLRFSRGVALPGGHSIRDLRACSLVEDGFVIDQEIYANPCIDWDAEFRANVLGRVHYVQKRLEQTVGCRARDELARCPKNTERFKVMRRYARAEENLSKAVGAIFELIISDGSWPWGRLFGADSIPHEDWVLAVLDRMYPIYEEMKSLERESARGAHIEERLALGEHLKAMNLPADVRQALIHDRRVVSDCVEWTGSFNKADGPYIKHSGKRIRVQHLVYRACHGDEPDYKHPRLIHAHCNNPKCVGRAHLEPHAPCSGCTADQARQARDLLLEGGSRDDLTTNTPDMLSIPRALVSRKYKKENGYGATVFGLAKIQSEELGKKAFNLEDLREMDKQLEARELIEAPTLFEARRKNGDASLESIGEIVGIKSHYVGKIHRGELYPTATGIKNYTVAFCDPPDLTMSRGISG